MNIVTTKDNFKNTEEKGLNGKVIRNVTYARKLLSRIDQTPTNILRVIDIKADACQTSAGVEYARFLVSYCGDLDKNPEVVHKVVEADIPKDKCPQVDQEWVK